MSAFEHCRWCIRMVGSLCRERQKCTLEQCREDSLAAIEGFDWYMDQNIHPPLPNRVTSGRELMTL